MAVPGHRHRFGYPHGHRLAKSPTHAHLAGDDVLDAAVQTGHVADETVFHSNRGAQYTSDAFTTWCTARGITTGLGRTGVCWDNAAAESFFASLKNECYHQTTFTTRAAARLAVADCIEVFYNRQQIRSTLECRAPAPVEAVTAYCDSVA